jgi:hypothetical protein
VRGIENSSSVFPGHETILLHSGTLGLGVVYYVNLEEKEEEK